MSLTDDDADFTALIVKSAGHHGADGVVHHRHDVGIVVLEGAEELRDRRNPFPVSL